jgi:ankyrin repeat protein
MPHIRKLIFLTILLTLTAGCGNLEDGDASSNSANTTAANSNATVNAGTTAGRKLSEQEGALLIAAAKGDTKTVKGLLDKGVNVDTRDPSGNTTPLGHAVWGGHDDTARLLIERGADVNAKTDAGVSILAFATTRKHKDLADMLRDKGAK